MKIQITVHLLKINANNFYYLQIFEGFRYIVWRPLKPLNIYIYQIETKMFFQQLLKLILSKVRLNEPSMD